MYSQPLVYVELFNIFHSSVSPFSGLNRTSSSFSPDGRRESAVVPLADFALACHMAPQFSLLEADGVLLTAQTDLLQVARRFFFNHYYSYYIFMLVEHWCKRRAQG
jgi:hypothetical protein